MRNDAEPGFPADERMLAYLLGEHHPKQALLPRAMFMAVEGSKPVGYTGGHRTTRYGCHGEVQYLYVLPDCPRRGVAHALLLELATWFVSQGARRICVDVGSQEGRQFYAWAGATDLTPHWMVWEDIAAVGKHG